MSVIISLLKNRWMAMAVSLLSLSIAFYIDTYKEHKESNYGEIISGLEEHLNKRERFIDKTLANDSLLNSFLKTGFDNENRKKLDKKNIVLVIYKDTTSVFWSSNIVDPSIIYNHPVNEVDALQTPNGWYMLKKKKAGEYTYALLYHFYIQYQYQNRYLQNHFNPQTKIRHTAIITAIPTQDLSPVKSIYGKKLFYIGLHPSRHKTFTVPIIIFTLLGLWMFFVFLSAQYEWFIERHMPFAGTLFFGIVLVLLKLLLIDLKFPSFLQSSSLFDPSIYASGLFSSLGSLLVNTVLLFVFVFTLTKQTGSYYNEKNISHKNWLQGLLFISSFFALILFTGFIITVIRSLVLDSKIPFDIANIIHFTWYSFIGLLITALLVTIHFLTTSLVYRYIERINATSRQLVLYATASVAIYVIYLWITGRLSLPTALQGPTYAFSLLLVFQLSAGFKMVQKTLAYVLVASVFVALLFYRFNIDKEHEMRKLYAIQLGDSQDIEAENIFRDIEHQIATDQRIHKYFTNAIFGKRDLEKHIKQLYFSGYLTKYDIEIFDYDTAGNSYREKNYFPHEVVDNLYNNSAQPTLSNYFYLILNPSVQYNYIAKYDFCVGTTNVGSLYILLKKKLIQDQSLFNELLAQSSSAGMQPLYAYSYAMYQDNKLVNKGGKYSYTLDFSIDTTRGKDFIVENGYNHLVRTEPNNIILVVSRRVDSILQPLAVFSFIFLLLLLFIALLFLYNGIVMLLRAGLAYYTGKWKPLYRFYRFSHWLIPISRLKGVLFSTRIQITMFALVSVILVLSGYLFFQYIDFKYTERQREKMVQKIKSVAGSFENEIQFDMQLMLPSELTAYLNQIGDFYESDITLYDSAGHVIASTKNKIFTSGLIARYIDPRAFEKLKSEKVSFYIHEEKIGYLKYISAYVPVLDQNHQAFAYLNLPFFANEAELNEEISAFFVNFVNLYILFFLVAALTAYVITQRITAPLTLIRSKLAKLSLGSQNEVIEWKGDDEIGELVAQYNKMILALEESAEKLAEGEREGAWREMAKQIAHEIKNPLTPMKLSIQHLQRAWADGRDNLDETFKRVTTVLIEQIDSLSNLASEFSNFAKMPEPVIERLELNSMLQLVTHLYEDTENIEVNLHPANGEIYTMADKDQLSRVFKNIVINAIQAIPEGRHGKIDIFILKEENSVKISFSDNGKGIDAELAPKVFIPSFSTKTSGMGLGLAISKKIIESVGGKIYFESTPGAGTTFYIELPVSE